MKPQSENFKVDRQSGRENLRMHIGMELKGEKGKQTRRGRGRVNKRRDRTEVRRED